MKRRRVTLVVSAFVVAVAIFAFAPVVYSPIHRPDQLAFLGNIPAYESLSCTVFGVGISVWDARSFSGADQWLYQTTCPTYRAYAKVGV